MINAISLTGFKCFESLGPINLSQINLFTGSNGRGKSSVFQSLLLLSQSLDKKNGSIDHLEINGDFVKLGTFDDVCNINSKNKSFSINYTTDDLTENSINVGFKRHPSKDRWANFCSFFVNGKNLIENASSAEVINDEKSLRTKKTGNNIIGVTSTIAVIRQLLKVYYVSADRMGPMDYAEKNDNRESNNLGIHGEHTINTVALLNNREKFIKDICGNMSYIMSGASMRIDTKDADFLKFFLDSVDNSKGFRPNNVGFGYSYILPIVLTCSIAESHSIIFIVNPEAHLHPGSQSRLMKFIINSAKKNKHQLFIETHSDHVINSIRIAVKEKLLDKNSTKILHFTRESIEQPKCWEINIDREGNLSDYPEGFMDEWAAQMSKLV